MELAHILNELWRRRVWLAVGLVLAVAAPVKVIYEVPSFEKKEGQAGVATTDILVDSERSPIGNVNTDIVPLASRASIYSRLIGSPPVKDRIARLVGVPSAAIAFSGPPSGGAQAGEASAPTALGGYLIQSAAAGEGQPVLSISTYAPTAEAAIRLADATAAGLAAYIRDLQKQGEIRRDERVAIEQLGAAHGGLTLRTVDYGDAFLAYLAAFVGWCLFVLLAGRVIAGLREARAGEKRHEDIRAAGQLS